jgi:hypothetical protein
VPDERCTIIILAMLAHDLLFLNNSNTNEIDFRHQIIFEELKEKYSNDDESIIEMKKEEIEIIREDTIHSSETFIANDIAIEEIITLKLSITYPTQDTHPIPIILSEEEDKTKVMNLLSQSLFDTMNYDILDRLELLSELNDDDEDEDSFNSARSSSTSRIDHRRTSMASISLDDFIELEKTIENEEIKTNTSSFLIDETISSEVDSIESNKLDEVS